MKRSLPSNPVRQRLVKNLESVSQVPDPGGVEPAENLLKKPVERQLDRTVPGKSAAGQPPAGNGDIAPGAFHFADHAIHGFRFRLKIGRQHGHVGAGGRLHAFAKGPAQAGIAPLDNHLHQRMPVGQLPAHGHARLG